VLELVSVLLRVEGVDGGAGLEPGPAIGCHDPCDDVLEKELELGLVLASWKPRERMGWSKPRNGVVKRPWRRELRGRDVGLSCCTSPRVCRGQFSLLREGVEDKADGGVSLVCGKWVSKFLCCCFCAPFIPDGEKIVNGEEENFRSEATRVG